MNKRRETMTKHNIEKLPKWAQQRIKDADESAFQLSLELASMERRLSVAGKANEITQGRGWEWLTIGPTMTERRMLFFLDKKGAHPVAEVGDGNLILIGRTNTVKQ